MIPDQYNHLPDRLKLLFEWGNPSKKNTSYRDWENYLPHGFSEADVPVLLELTNHVKQLEEPEEEDHLWVPIYAWRILGQLKSVEAIEPLFALTIADECQNDDWVCSEVPVALGMIGKPAMAKAVSTLLGDAEKEYTKQIASDVLTEMAMQYPELREEIIAHFRAYLQSPDLDYYGQNGLLVAHLIKLEAVELIDEIRALYEEDCVDMMVAGDIEEVEIALGLRQERSTPKPRNGIADMLGLSELLGAGASEPPSSTRRQHDPDDYAVLKTPETYIREDSKVGRNDPCPCGSGKKYKRCCLN